MIRTLILLIAASAGLAGAEKPVALYLSPGYIDPEIVKAFTAKTGMEVRIATYEAPDEMAAKLQDGGNAVYDVVVVTDVAIPSLIQAKLLQPIDRKRITHLGNVDFRFLNPAYDKGNEYSLPYQWGMVGLLYRKDKAPEGDPTWAWVLGDKAAEPFLLIDDMRTMIGIALRYQGKSVNCRMPGEVRTAGELVTRAFHHAKSLGFESGNAMGRKVAGGEAALGVADNADAVRAMGEDPGLAFAIPREGSTRWVDSMVVCSKAPNPAGANAFIDFILDAEIGAKLSNYNRYATPNRAALAKIPEEDRGNPAIYPSDETMKSLEDIEDLGHDGRIYDAMWTDLKEKARGK